MVRFSLLLAVLFGSVGLHAADLGRTDRLWREYLNETVRRGQPLLATDPVTGVVPFWPALVRARAEAESLEPGGDVVLLGAWIDQAEGRGSVAVSALRAAWPRPALVRWSPRVWGETLFALWSPLANEREWSEAWLGWTEKAYSPRGLLLGLEAFEKLDPSAVVPLLIQARELYPEDRRFLPLVARHPEVHPQAKDLIARDRLRSEGWASSTLRRLLNREPGAHSLLVDAGYRGEDLGTLLSRDYGTLVKQSSPAPSSGSWTWDSDHDGTVESHLILEESSLVTWSRRTAEGLWTLSLRGGKPETLTETRLGATWTLRWEAYPLADTLEYRWGERSFVYRFRPLSQSIPLWPAERLKAPSWLYPAVLADQWLPLDPRGLAASASTVESWVGELRVEVVSLFQGEVWLQVQDTNRDGVDDLFSYFRSGRLASVYSAPEGRQGATLRELYNQGELVQVHARAETASRNIFVLFPHEGVQLWDPHGDGRPLERLFSWRGEDRLGALVFSQDELPWETMPSWEPRP